MERRLFITGTSFGLLFAAGGGLAACTSSDETQKAQTGQPDGEASYPNDSILPVPSWLANTVAVDGFESSITVDGTQFHFGEGSYEAAAQANTMYGPASVTTVTQTSGSITRVTTVYALDDFDDTYLLQQHFTFDESVTVDDVNVLSLLADGADLRLAYGPANGTAYMEDYSNIPAVRGYAKEGDMLDGGLPLNYVWGPDGGVALGVLTAEPGTFSLPLAVSGETVAVRHRYRPRAEFLQQREFVSGDTYESDIVFVSYNQGDYFAPTDRYTKLLERVGGRDIQNQPAPSFASGAYWKTWGLDPTASGDFTKEQIREIADELEELGIDWILLDWGWFATEGHWFVNDDIFDDEDDLEDFITELRDRGFHVGLWFQPLQVDVSDDRVEYLLPLVVRDSDLDVFIDDDDLALLDPSKDEVVQYVLDHISRFADMGVENLYLDSQMAQLASPPNFANERPLDSHLALPGLYREIRDRANELGMAIEICPDGRSQSILNLPQHVNNIGDPRNDQQLRAEHKSLKAILGSRAIVGVYVDPFEDNGVSGSFLNIMATGGQLQTMFRDQDDLGADNWARSMAFFNDAQLATGDYLDLYDIGFDYPEGHVVAKGATRYYSFFTRPDSALVCLDGTCEDDETFIEAEAANPSEYEGDLTLRGLDPGAAYALRRYPEVETEQVTASPDGEVVLADQQFDREVLFIISN